MKDLLYIECLTGIGKRVAQTREKADYLLGIVRLGKQKVKITRFGKSLL